MAATTQFKGAKGRLIQTGRTTRSVFVSYCHADFRDRDAFLKFLRPMCERLGDQLDEWCFWVDSADLVGGDRWKDEIRDALAQADVYIVLMSQDTWSPRSVEGSSWRTSSRSATAARPA